MPAAPRKTSTKAVPAKRAAPAAKTTQAAEPAPPEAVNAAKAPSTGAKAQAKAVKKDKKPKLVRDSFTIPKVEYAVLESLKQRAARAGAPAKKSEVLRAGIKALAGLSDAAFLAAMAAVPSLKTGRPAKG